MTDNRSDFALRRMEREDLAAALAIQSENYPTFLVEDEKAFASRLDVAAPYCLAATLDGALVGYLLAHGWPSCSPPAVGEHLSRDAPSEVLYIHDLGVASAARGSGIGRELVAHALRMAGRDGLERAELIAVEGAAGFWRAMGFAEGPCSPALAGKVAGYGDEARWMTMTLGSDSPVS